jgi:polysaccharide biosynthesis/export protein
MRAMQVGWLLAVAALASGGCLAHHGPIYMPPPPGAVPTELNKVTLPQYVIEPPDILLIEVTLPPEKLGEPSKLLSPQPVAGQHIVRIDGTVGLGIYGSVQLAGLTLDQAREAIRDFFAQVNQKSPDGFPFKPEKLQIVVDVFAFNSKSYYVFFDGGGYGEQVYQFPATGNETVLDAIAKINGLPFQASKRNIWVARRSPHGGHEQILPVDWVGLSQHGKTETNYQVLPGDRIYVRADKLIASNNFLNKLLTPIERVFAFILLGSETVSSVNQAGGGGGGGGGGF